MVYASKTKSIKNTNNWI